MNHVIVLLDETGSMTFGAKETVSALNEYFNGLKVELKGKRCKVLVKCFDSERYRTLRECSIQKFEDIALNEYTPKNMTNLYDSIAKLLNEARDIVKPKDKVYFIIDTDGEENFSKEYSLSTVKTLLDECKEAGWEILFLGSGLDEKAAGAVAKQGHGMHLNSVATSHGMRGATYAGIRGQTLGYFSK